MDESGFRVGMMKGEIVYIPEDASDIYQLCPENRKQVTITETINASGEFLPPFIIIQGLYHMQQWYNTQQEGDESIGTGPARYTTTQITLDWLDHWPKMTNQLFS